MALVDMSEDMQARAKVREASRERFAPHMFVRHGLVKYLIRGTVREPGDKNVRYARASQTETFAHKISVFGKAEINPNGSSRGMEG